MYSTDPTTGESGFKEVVQLYVKETDVLVHINVGGEEITTTPDHPFRVGNIWICAKNLRAGDLLTLADGSKAAIEKIQTETLAKPVTVYNFEVADFHTYYVGNVQVLVHNDCSAGGMKTPNDKGYYQDVNGRWHRQNGQFASNAEVGITKPITSSTNGVHGNSLANPKTNYGYALVETKTGNVLKYGESISPNTRYTQTFLKDNDAMMDVMTSGSKYDIHMWQHQQILGYRDIYGKLPPSNLST